MHEGSGISAELKDFERGRGEQVERGERERMKEGKKGRVMRERERQWTVARAEEEEEGGRTLSRSLAGWGKFGEQCAKKGKRRDLPI